MAVGGFYYNNKTNKSYSTNDVQRLRLKGSKNLVLHIDDASLEKWNRRIYAMLSMAGPEAARTVKVAANTIRSNSLFYVPRDTNTLARSSYIKINSQVIRGKLSEGTAGKSDTFITAEIGYGDDEAAGPNPSSGTMPSKYAWQVHEDLRAHHEIGQAKYLERAFREYAFLHWPNEMIELERTIYTSDKAKPIYRHGSKDTTFLGWKRPTKIQSVRDTRDNSKVVTDIQSLSRRT